MLGTSKDFEGDETAYFRMREDFRSFAKELGVMPEAFQDPNAYIQAVQQVADFYAKTGRLDEARAQARLGLGMGGY